MIEQVNQLENLKSKFQSYSSIFAIMVIYLRDYPISNDEKGGGPSEGRAFCSLAQSITSTFLLLLLLHLVLEPPKPKYHKAGPILFVVYWRLFSVMGIGIYYFIISKLGLSTMISLGLSGQLIFALVACHYV